MTQHDMDTFLKSVIEWQTTVPSRSEPGKFHTVTKYKDGHYDCDCPGRKFNFMCHHVAGAILLLEGHIIKTDLTGKAARPMPKTLNPAFLNEKRLAHTTLETWHDELFQKYLSDALGSILRFVIAHPGVCSAEVADGLHTRRDHITHSLRMLVDAGLLDDTQTKENPQSKRKNKSYIPTKLAGS